MRALTSRRCRLAMIAALFALAGPADAQDKALPAASVPIPPPEPPPRPAELRAEPPSMAATGEGKATVPVPPPEPPPRPAELKAEPPAAAPRAEDKPTVPIPPPEPPARPAELSAPDLRGAAKPADSADTPPLPPDAPLPPARPADLSGQAALKLVVSAADDTACLRRIERLGVKFEKMEPITNGQCSVAKPLNVSALADGVTLEPNDTMICGITEALARWTTEVQVTAQTELGDTLKSLKIGGGYTCRGQNNAGEAKLSEHSYANAVDIMGFTFAKHPPIMIAARPEGSPEAAFQNAVWAKACKFFRTVLGPGSNASHDTHLHLDERERSGRQRLCE